MSAGRWLIEAQEAEMSLQNDQNRNGSCVVASTLPVPGLAKGPAVLELLAQSRRDVTLSEISRQAAAPSADCAFASGADGGGVANSPPGSP